MQRKKTDKMKWNEIDDSKKVGIMKIKKGPITTWHSSNNARSVRSHKFDVRAREPPQPTAHENLTSLTFSAYVTYILRFYSACPLPCNPQPYEPFFYIWLWTGGFVFPFCTLFFLVFYFIYEPLVESSRRVLWWQVYHRHLLGLLLLLVCT